MPENKHARFLLRLLYLLVWGAGLWLALKYLLPWLLPFLLALGLAALLEPAVRGLMRLRLPRWGAAALCTAALAAVLCALLALAVWRCAGEAAALLTRLPALLDRLSLLGGRFEAMSYRFLVAVPPSLRDILSDTLEGFVAQGLSLPGRLYDWLGGAVARAAAALPGAGLFLFTTTLAAYFISAGRPTLSAFLSRQIPPRWRPFLDEAGRQLRGTLGGWLRAQGLLMLITFGELTLGFFLLRVDLALVLAALTALVDALPVFGTGTVLLPWAILSLLGGDLRLALGLLALYALVSLVRSLLEPKLLGARIGLPPLAALIAMYVGFRAFGVAGMILAPLALTFLKQLHDCGLVRLWKD